MFLKIRIFSKLFKDILVRVQYNSHIKTISLKVLKVNYQLIVI